jgi:ubiquinone/menaquinone biosynthesis C-methylase UbiE
MQVREAYNLWAEQYDTNRNRTRDLEAISLRETLADMQFEHCLEIGCGTGKNTEWLMTRSQKLTALDLSDEMLRVAREKIRAEHVTFIQHDILQDWSFGNGPFDLVTFSLVLEHIEDLNAIFRKLAAITNTGSLVYVGELHPFKQYNGTKARFETPEGVHTVTCFNHHVSDFTTAAKQHGFEIEMLTEYFDDNDRSTLPRVLTLLFRKN